MKNTHLCLENVTDWLKIIFDKSQEAAISVNQEGIILYCNQSVVRMFGYHKELLIGKKINLLMSQPYQYQHKNYLAAYCHTSIQEATHTIHPAIGLRQDASGFPLGVSASEAELIDARIYIGFLHDLTAIKKTETELAERYEELSNARAAALNLMEDAEAEKRRAEQALADLAEMEGERYKLALAIEQCPTSVVMTDDEGCIEFVNPAYCEVSGYTEKEVDGKKHNIFKPERTTKDQNNKLWADIREGKNWKGEFRNARKNGEPYWTRVTIAPVRNRAKEIKNYLVISEDITQWKETEIALDQFKTTLDRTKDCIFMFCPDTLAFFYANQGAVEQLGYSNDELLKMTPLDLIPEYDEDHFVEILVTPLLNGEKPSITFESWHQHKSGQLIPVEIFLQYIAPEGEPARFLAIVNDISKRKYIENQMIDAREDAEAANQAKSNFLAAMSHEIRTPMNAIIGMSYLARQTKLTAKQQNFLNKIDGAAHTLMGIINNILDFSKVEAGKIELENIDFNLQDVIDNVCNLTSIQIQEKGLELILDVSPDLPISLVGDSLRLGQVLINLVNNACKFTETGSITLKIVCIAHEDNHVLLEFSVQDTGIGMKTAEQENLFESFRQADNSTTRKYGGSGLGLVICKNLVELMNGKISVASCFGEGSIFSFTARFGAQENLDGKQPFESILEAENLHVLVIDDDQAVCHVIQMYLAHFGCKVMIASSSKEATRLLETASPQDKMIDLVFLDCNMPSLSGGDAVRMILKNKELSPNLPIIMTTSFPYDTVKQGPAIVGIQFFLNKPITPTLLLDAIMEALGQGIPERIRLLLQSRQTQYVVKGLRGAKILLVEDNAVNQELTATLLNDVGILPTVVENGQLALDILAKERFDGVLMDLDMPVMDGYTATRKIREQACFKDLPIIAITANVMNNEREKVLKVGMNDYISEPINVRSMFLILSRWITPSEPVDIIVEDILPEMAADNSFPILPGIDTQIGLATVQSNQMLYYRILAKFRDEQAEFVRLFNHHYEHDEHDEAQWITHVLKGLASNIGAQKLQQAAAALELTCKKGADAEEITKRLQHVAFALSEVFTSLDKWLLESTDGNDETVSTTNDNFDHEIVKPVFDETAALLAANNVRAICAFERLKALLGNASTLNIILIEKYIDQYDFESALEMLRHLAKGCGILLKE